MWYCYILRNKLPQYKNLTYNGSTNDPFRRLRQHNEEISGGARFTHGKGGAWEIYALMSGFEDHINTLSCEWRIKHPSGKPGPREPKYRGVIGRIKSLNDILQQAGDHMEHTYTSDDSYSNIQTSKATSKSGWCYIGEDRGFRSCINIGDNSIGGGDKCMSGDIFPTQNLCINPKLRF